MAINGAVLNDNFNVYIAVVFNETELIRLTTFWYQVCSCQANTVLG